MNNIVALPAVLVFLLLCFYKPRDLYIYLFIPTLIIFPIYYRIELFAGTPEYSFWSAALTPIIIFWLFFTKREGYYFSWLDVIIIGHILLIGYNEWHNSTYKNAQKIAYNDFTMRLAPYIMAKVCSIDKEYRIKLLKILVFTTAFVGFFMIFESKLWFNVFDDTLKKILTPDIKKIPLTRFGFKRAYGPFIHAVYAGYFFATIFPIAIWLWYEKAFSKDLWLPVRKQEAYIALMIMAIPFLLIPLTGLNQASIINMALGISLLIFTVTWARKYIPWGVALTAFTIIGALATISRAPVLGMLLQLAIISIGWAKRKAIVILLLLVIATFVLPVAVEKAYSYINIEVSSASTGEQKSAAYRLALFHVYGEIIIQKPYFGWGHTALPLVPSFVSIDNEYIFMALASGLVAVAIYLLTILWSLIRLGIYVMRNHYHKPETRLAWCFVAGLLALMVIQLTVYRGSQNIQLLYILLGLSEGLVIAQKYEVEVEYEGNKLKSHCYSFARTL